MFVKELEYNDYETLLGFWKWFRFPAPPRQMLPNDGTGGLKIVDESGTIICAGFIYETNSKIAWIEWTISNPDIKDRKLRKEAEVMLIAHLTVECEEKGFEAAFSCTSNEFLILSFKEVGYMASKPNKTELIFKI